MSPLVVAFGVIAVIAACHGAPPPAAEPATECPTTGARACRDANDCGAADFHCTGGHCYANQVGCSCAETSECGGSAHCAKGMCYANGVGAPCSSTGDCGPRAHCSGSSCYANAAGSPCSAEPECGSGSACVSGTCN